MKMHHSVKNKESQQNIGNHVMKINIEKKMAPIDCRNSIFCKVFYKKLMLLLFYRVFIKTSHLEYLEI